jgi:hypothetical protein
MKMREAYDYVKLKPVWGLLILSVAWIVHQQGWPAPAFDSMVVKATAVFMGSLIGLLVDATHYRLWPPQSTDPDYENRRRRQYFIIAGMLAMALSV